MPTGESFRAPYDFPGLSLQDPIRRHQQAGLSFRIVASRAPAVLRRDEMMMECDRPARSARENLGSPSRTDLLPAVAMPVTTTSPISNYDIRDYRRKRCLTSKRRRSTSRKRKETRRAASGTSGARDLISSRPWASPIVLEQFGRTATSFFARLGFCRWCRADDQATVAGTAMRRPRRIRRSASHSHGPGHGTTLSPRWLHEVLGFDDREDPPLCVADTGLNARFATGPPYASRSIGGWRCGARRAGGWRRLGARLVHHRPPNPHAMRLQTPAFRREGGKVVGPQSSVTAFSEIAETWYRLAYRLCRLMSILGGLKSTMPTGPKFGTPALQPYASHARGSWPWTPELAHWRKKILDYYIVSRNADPW